MKYKGRQLSGPRTKVVPIIRTEEEGGNIIFTVKGILDLDPFYLVCPMPVAPNDTLPGGKTRPNPEHPVYKAQINDWWTKRSAWMAINSLKDSPDVEWELVKLDDPETWGNWQKELQQAGLADAEIGRILSAIMDVNGLNESLVEEARQSFLTTQANRVNGQSSPVAAQSTTPSGTPVSESASDHQDTKEQTPGTN